MKYGGIPFGATPNPAGWARSNAPKFNIRMLGKPPKAGGKRFVPNVPEAPKPKATPKKNKIHRGIGRGFSI